MKEIVIISGKGGTGKTTFAAAFACLARDTAVVADCDVDAADMHLLLAPAGITSENFYSGFVAEIDAEKCSGCLKCLEICRFDAITNRNNTAVIDDFNCEGCGYCFEVCPEKAINLNKANVGEIISARSRFPNKFVYGKLNIGAENSGKLVAEVKSTAKKFALEENKNIIIVDGSPGIGCPVIASIAGASLVVIVTEPTVSGLHDLKRIAEVVEKFKIPAACIINKYNLNIDKASEIEKYLKQNKIELAGKIPYSEIFPMSISEGKTIIEFSDNGIKEEVEKIWTFINQIKTEK